MVWPGLDGFRTNAKGRDVTKSIYYLPGHGGRLHTGLGEGLLGRGFNVAGRETVREFRSLPFQEQIQAVAEDLSTFYWSNSNSH